MSPASIFAGNSVIVRFRWLVLAYSRDLIAIALSAFLAFELRFDGALPSKYYHLFWVSLGIWLPLKLTAFVLFGVNRGLSQYTSFYEAQRIGWANAMGSLVGGIAIFLWLGPSAVPRSIYFLEWIVSSFVLLSGRLAMRAAVGFRSNRRPEGLGTRTLIYGAGSAGLQLLVETRQNRALMCDVVGLIDDDRSKVGLILDGKKVLGTGESLKVLAKKHSVKQVFIAIPSATGPQIMRILKQTSAAAVEYKMVPSLGELISDKRLAGQIRNIAVEDLLGRQSVQLDQRPIRERLEGKVVMVTGAAGSIGSELCRQIARFHPKALIGFDQAETPLFQIDRELNRKFPGLEFHPEIGDITDPVDLHRVMGKHHPTILYHAAAYKHVPLMEQHVLCAVKNNVLGTWRTALSALKYGVEDFVLISTDKAVRPTSVMGATKRIAELITRGLQSANDTRFVAVRFGNVLGSNGSVVPVFKEQIASGGPVTVTHPEMRRNFMTIPEAAQLVLQASSFGHGGDLFILDMGEPVKITDLAQNLILLSGLKPDEDIRIQFTGLRPGEKLFEELNLSDESSLATPHSKIRRYASSSGLGERQLSVLMREIQQVVERGNLPKLLSILEETIPDYTPSMPLLNVASASAEPPRPRSIEIVTSHDASGQAASVGFSPIPEAG
jgi:FlaA1/EpsC-like NDP-sugar epimerase